MNDIIKQIRQDLKANIDEKTKQNFQRFFKEQIKSHGVKTATVHKIANIYWKQVKNFDKPEIFRLCEELFSSGYIEEAFMVSFWLPNYIGRLDSADLMTFKRWIESYIDDWAKCDSFCNHTIGDLIQKYPQIINEVKNWAKSNNRWFKRASAVSIIVPAKKGLLLEDAFEICDELLLDSDDIVQKGYGWLLKEASRVHQKEVYEYVVKNKAVMPRTALRYAIELMPKNLRYEAMKKA